MVSQSRTGSRTSRDAGSARPERHTASRINHRDFAVKLPQNDPLIQRDGLRDSAASSGLEHDPEKRESVFGRRSCSDAIRCEWSPGTRGMRDIIKRLTIVAAVAVLAAANGACGSSQLSDISATSLLPKMDQLSRPDWLTYSGGKNEFELRAVTAADLVNADGQCPMATAEAPPGSATDAAQPGMVPGGIALQMTECDVVRRAGSPEQVQVGAEPNGDRSVVMTYTRGPRPGIYRFAAGRLASVERAPEAPGAKASPKAKSSKKAPRS
jgi:hypothetical protein